MGALFTLGYEKLSVGEFIELLRAAGIDVLVDVRDSPWSRKPGFSRKPLERALAAAGIEYIHAKFAGNPKHLRESAKSPEVALARYGRHLDENPAILDEFSALVAELHGRGERVCITCLERDPKDCHRGILASRWRERIGGEVIHLAPQD